MVLYHYTKIGINSNSLIDLSVEFALKYAISIAISTDNKVIKKYYKDVIKELKETEFKALFKNITP